MAGASDSIARPSLAVLPPSDWRGRVLGWRPPYIAATLALIAGLAQGLLWGEAAPWGRSIVAGSVLFAAGAGWMGWAFVLLRRAGTAMRSTLPPRVFVDTGPYRLGRHPMYLGLVAMVLGAAWATGSPALLLAAVMLAVLLHRVHIPHEEAQALHRFGGWYGDYAGSVRRWF